MPTAEELLRAPLLKLERARDHINDLKFRVQQFLAKRPFVFMERHEPKSGQTTYYVKVNEPVPPEFSLIIGDAVHNLRAALDVALFAMAGAREPKIRFPFPKEGTSEALYRAIKHGHVEAAGKKVVEAITNIEPYVGGKGIGLHCIHALDIQDKHRLLILAGKNAAILTGSESDVLLRGIIPDDTPPGIPVVFKPSEVTGVFTIRRPYANPDLPDSVNETNPQPDFAITFGEGEILAASPIVEILVHSANEVERAVRELVTAFLSSENGFS